MKRAAFFSMSPRCRGDMGSRLGPRGRLPFTALVSRRRETTLVANVSAAAARRTRARRPIKFSPRFAGNPLFISAEKLRDDGLLDEELPAFPSSAVDKVDFNAARDFKDPFFEHAFAHFEKNSELKAPFDSFCRRHKSWLEDYALFCALKQQHGGTAWDTWENPLRRREPAALKKAHQQFRSQVRYHQFLQFVFFEQWSELKAFCLEREIKLMGDIPIFVAHDSADVWANPQLFYLDDRGASTVVAGCPPDYFSATGQRWGNPLYRWDVLKKSGYAWWIKRFQIMFELFDATRLDHFIGFTRYWRIPADHPTAENGEWIAGPGLHFFKTVFRKLGRLQLIAEDFGLGDRRCHLALHAINWSFPA